MYNFDNQDPPLFLPVAEGVQLKPWFTTAQLDGGLTLIRNKEIDGFHCLRNSTGALIGRKAFVSLQFQKSSQLLQGFSIHQRHCELCRLKKTDSGCEHLAALAILSLIIPPDQTKARPIPLAFHHGDWQKLGGYLYQWFAREAYTTHRIAGSSLSVWKITSADISLEAAIPHSWLFQAEQLFADGGNIDEPEPARDAFTKLNKRLQSVEISDSERQLQAAGRNSQGWNKENSLWLWLARMLFIFHNHELPVLRREISGSSFSLKIGKKGQQAGLKISIPGEKALELARNIPVHNYQTKILPTAKECYRVGFNQQNSLDVIPCLRLEDGRILERRSLAANRLQGAYYLDGEGFLPVQRAPGEGQIVSPVANESTHPLLGFLEDETSKDKPFTVSPNDIASFLEMNTSSLNYALNIIDPALLKLHIRELPDRLIIDSFEEREGWCYLSCHYGLGTSSISLDDIQLARDKKMSCVPGNQWLNIEKTALTWFYDLLDGRVEPDEPGTIRLNYQEVMALTAIVPSTDIEVKEESIRKKLSSLINLHEWTDSDSLTSVPDHLRPYQRNGMAWLVTLFRFGIGGLLADDMGLGKTHQALALLQHATHETKSGQMLVVCPSSVVLNWAEKIDQFYQGLDYFVYYGQHRNPKMLEGRSVVITTYGVIRQDIDQLQHHHFDIILLDEIQYLKNPKTATHKAVAALACEIKIGLTGTPIENSLQDLRALFEICLPGLLGTENQFRQLYENPIANSDSSEVRDRLSRLISPFILRRSREQVLTELPAIIEDDRICELSDDQVALYREIIDDREDELEYLTDEQSQVPYMTILTTITRLKQLCDHPCLIQDCSEQQEYSSGKWDLFTELTKELLDANMKFVVFSQYTRMLELIEQYLKNAGITYGSLKGNMSPTKRQKMIAEFNHNPRCRVFCASLLAGGIGIDLTAARAVIHYDRWWNPAKEQQATGRVHRMGQKNVVQVFRLITRGTLEEKIHLMIQKKKGLASSLLHEDEAGIVKKMSREQLAELFRFSPMQ
jgi:superfamily II DNA or RNA helicase